MIKVIARSMIKENALNKVLDLYAELVEKTRQEENCIAYELYQDIDNENHLTLIEEWKDLESLEEHTKTNHFIDIVSKLSEYETELPIMIYKKLF